MRPRRRGHGSAVPAHAEAVPSALLAKRTTLPSCRRPSRGSTNPADTTTRTTSPKRCRGPRRRTISPLSRRRRSSRHTRPRGRAHTCPCRPRSTRPMGPAAIPTDPTYPPLPATPGAGPQATCGPSPAPPCAGRPRHRSSIQGPSVLRQSSKPRFMHRPSARCQVPVLRLRGGFMQPFDCIFGLTGGRRPPPIEGANARTGGTDENCSPSTTKGPRRPVPPPLPASEGGVPLAGWLIEH